MKFLLIHTAAVPVARTCPKRFLPNTANANVVFSSIRCRNEWKIYWPGSGIRTKMEIEEEVSHIDVYVSFFISNSHRQNASEMENGRRKVH